MHAHTVVMSHRIGPADARMVARCPVVCPFPCQRQRASVCVERQLVRAWRVESGEWGTGTIDGKDVARTMPIPQTVVALDL